MSSEYVETARHPFETAPHRTLFYMSVPVLFSLIAEPLTALVDTAFVSRLGAVPLASLGVGATLLSSVFWVFNFLGIGGQTAVAQALGTGDRQKCSRVNTQLLLVAIAAGFALIFIGIPLTPLVASLMGAEGEVSRLASSYMNIRWLGAPAVLVAVAAFGVLRGSMDMRTPLWIALGINVLNLGLDAVLIFGCGPVPALGVQGAALASTISQWVGAVWACWIVARRFGFVGELKFRETVGLLQIGGDLFVRTGLLNLFLILATRTATLGGSEVGAAHQAIRQSWVFTVLLLDSFAITSQSLVGYFMGSSSWRLAKRVAGVSIVWSVGAGMIIGFLMLVGQDLVLTVLVPLNAAEVFVPAWRVSALVQPLNAVSFATDGIHWGSGDFRFLRNVVVVVSAISFLGLSLIDPSQPTALTWIWIVTALWLGMRGAAGILRIWPGIGRAPLSGVID